MTGVLYAVALCGMVAALFAATACLLGVLWPVTRPAVTARTFGLMTVWGTVFVFAGVLLPIVVTA